MGLFGNMWLKSKLKRFQHRWDKGDAIELFAVYHLCLHVDNCVMFIEPMAKTPLSAALVVLLQGTQQSHLTRPIPSWRLRRKDPNQEDLPLVLVAAARRW